MWTKLETVAINDVLPLKAARRDAVANLKSFWTPGQQRLDFDGFTYIHYVAPTYSAGIVIIVIDSVHGGRVHIPVQLFRRSAQSCRVENGPKISSFCSSLFKRGEHSNFSHVFANLAHFLTCRKILFNFCQSLAFAKRGNADSIYRG